MMRGGRGPRGARCRRMVRPGVWEVQARVERFVEPALLLLLAERPRHGYDLVERLPEVTGDTRRVDMGNLYRLLRALEREDVVASSWDEGAAGPARRIYKLTEAGRSLLDRWAESLPAVRSAVDAFIERYERREGVST